MADHQDLLPPAPRLKTGGRWLLEALIAALLVLLCFFAFLGLLNRLFPVGASLSAQTADSRLSTVDMARDALRELLLLRDGEPRRLTAGEPWAAELHELHNSVRSKRAADIAWFPARTGMALFDRDAVQTAEQSSALIRFDSTSSLRLGANSLVVIKRLERDALRRDRHSYLVMIDGELHGQLKAGGDDELQLEVATPAGTARIAARSGATDTEFRIGIHADQSSTISVFTGSAEVDAAGETVQVPARHSITLVPGAATPAPVPMLTPPDLRAPADGATIYYRDLPPRLRFEWAADPQAVDYFITLSTAADFSSSLIEERVLDAHWEHGDLRSGSYYWRVRARRPGHDGSHSATHRLTVVQDRDAPVLNVQFPAEAVHGTSLTLTGSTEPGARVLVAGQEVRPDTAGRFRHTLKLKPGAQVIVVEAVDAAGNVGYQSQLVRTRY